MKTEQLTDRIYQLGVIPVIALESIEQALPLADALIEGGLPIVEITFRTDAARQAISTLADHRPELLIGAGTILTIDHLKQAKEAGARFGLSPGLNPEIVRAAGELPFPFFPGIMTPSELESGLKLGVRIFKLFPAELSGGIKMVDSLAGPFGHTHTRFIPTGGIAQHHLKSYLSSPHVLAVGGSWIASKGMIARGDWKAMTKNAIRVGQEVNQIRAEPLPTGGDKVGSGEEDP